MVLHICSKELSFASSEVSNMKHDSLSMSSVDERIEILAMLNASEDRCSVLQAELDALIKVLLPPVEGGLVINLFGELFFLTKLSNSGPSFKKADQGFRAE